MPAVINAVACLANSVLNFAALSARSGYCEFRLSNSFCISNRTSLCLL